MSAALRAYRGLLKNGPLTRLLAGEFVSSIGDWLYLVALLIVVYEHSQDAVLLGVVGAARVLPYVLLSVPAGIAADRFDRRLILIVTDTARALIMVGIAWLVGDRTDRSRPSWALRSSRPAFRRSSDPRSARICRAWSVTNASSGRRTPRGPAGQSGFIVGPVLAGCSSASVG